MTRLACSVSTLRVSRLAESRSGQINQSHFTILVQSRARISSQLRPVRHDYPPAPANPKAVVISIWKLECPP